MRTFEKNNDIWIYCVLIVSSVLVAFFAVTNIKITPDSIRYALISDQILAGEGIRLPMIRLAYDFNIAANGTIPYLEQPPLVPFLLSLLGGMTPQDLWSARLLNIVSHTVVSLFTFLLMRRFSGNRPLALLTAVLVSISYPMLRMVNRIGSEPLFIAMTMASLYFVTCARDSGRNFILSGVFAAAAILTRFAGMALVPVLFWEVLMLIREKKIRERSVSAFLAVTIPLITTAGLFARNYMLSGTLRGFDQPSPGRSYADAFTGTLTMVFDQFQLGERAVLLIALLLFIAVAGLLFSSAWRRDFSNSVGAGLSAGIVFMLSYTALIFLAMATKQPRFELRYMSPLVPFLLITAMLASYFLFNVMRSRGGVVLLMAVVVMLMSFLMYAVPYKTYQGLPEIMGEQVKYDPFLRSCTYKWIRENCEDENIIAANDPFPLSFYGGYATLRLPHNRFNSNFLVPDDMGPLLTARMSEIGARILMLFNKVDEEHEGEYIARLFNERETNDDFELVYECEDGVVYKLRE